MQNNKTEQIKPKVTNPNLSIQSGEMLLHDAIASEHVEVDFDFIKVNVTQQHLIEVLLDY